MINKWFVLPMIEMFLGRVVPAGTAAVAIVPESMTTSAMQSHVAISIVAMMAFLIIIDMFDADWCVRVNGENGVELFDRNSE
jgi:hypothetical protein